MKTALTSTRALRNRIVWSAIGLCVAMAMLGEAHAGNKGESSNRTVPVMTQNVYWGANLEALVPAPTPANVEATFAKVQTTDFPARAQALALEIAAVQPMLIGLQEVALWRSQTPGDFSLGNFAPNAAAVEYDFLEILLDELDALGLSYVAVVEVPSFDAELPGVGRDLRVTDRDVILVRADLPSGEFQLSNPQGGVFAAATPVPLPLPPPFNVLPFRRGWCAVDAKYRGKSFRFISTHLDNLVVQVQFAQASELLAGPANTDLPVVLVGDFNSAASGTDFPRLTYDHLRATGFLDVWIETPQVDFGFTFGQSELLDNPTSLERARIDFILFRNGVPIDSSGNPQLDVISAERVSDDPLEITPTVNWISDHFGVAAWMELLP